MNVLDILRQLRALGVHIECQDGRLELRAGRRSVSKRLIEQARTVKSELILLLDNPESQKQRPSPTRGKGGTFREGIPSKAAESLVVAEECQVASFIDHQHSCGFQAPADIPAGWVGGLSRLRPDCPPGDIPMQRWQQFIADARRLLRNGTLAQAAALGWDEIDLFGCDDTKPSARIDQMGLVWLIPGWRVVSVSARCRDHRSADRFTANLSPGGTRRRANPGVGIMQQGDLR